MQKVVVLGSSGQLGSDLVFLLKTSNYFATIAASRLTLTNMQDVEPQLLQYADAVYIINCIAYTQVAAAEHQAALAFAINSEFVAILARFCAKHHIILIHISSDYVFDGMQRIPYTESSVPAPLNIYGQSKLYADMAIQATLSQYFIVRTASLFGGVLDNNMARTNFITFLLRKYQQADPVYIVEDQWSAPTYTADVARAIIALLTAGYAGYGIYHCTSSTNCSWFELAQYIADQCHDFEVLLFPITHAELCTKANLLRPQYSVLSLNKLQKFYQMPSYQAAITEYLQLLPNY